MPITYVKGDATKPQGTGPRIIMHICNTAGGWGAGFVVAVSKRWPEPEHFYREWARARVLSGKGLQYRVKGKRLLTSGDFELGQVQLVEVEPNLFVLNMLAQDGYGAGNRRQHRTEEQDDRPPIRYEALDECLAKANRIAVPLGATLHGPRFGTGLAGGRWTEIEPLIVKNLGSREVTIYDL